MQKFLKKKEEGFTLVELMIVVVIIGVLASTAIPAFLRFIARSKASEAGLQLKALFTGHATYYDDEHRARNYSAGALATTTRCLPGEFDFGLTPTENEQQPPALIATNPVLLGIDYELGDSIYFNYLGTSTSADCDQNPDAGGQLGVLRANGNLDGDSVLSTFEIAYGIPRGGAPLAQIGLWKNLPTE